MIELKRSINNNTLFFSILCAVFSFILGYFLLIGLDKIKNVSLVQLYYSTYTVITQFGMMIFSVVTINFINIDYREKNILFYRACQVSALEYFLKKVFLLFIEIMIPMLILTLCAGFWYGTTKNMTTMIFVYANAVFYTVLVSSTFAFFCKNILFAYASTLFFWIGGIIAVAMNEKLKYIAYYDASNMLYQNIKHYFEGGSNEFIWEGFFYNGVILVFILILVKFFSKKWEINGIG